MRLKSAMISKYLEVLARLHADIHAYPADQLGSLKVRLAANIARANVLGERRRQMLLDALADMREGDRLCQGDFHPKNVLGAASQPIVIDWPDACRGDPSADTCRSR
jgi:aminoglycoside phosphotransferase (APT) family kinase protein